MRKTLQVLRYEVFMITSRLSFWLALLALPVAAILMLGSAAYINQRQVSAPDVRLTGEAMAAVKSIIDPPQDTRPKGFLDPGGLIQYFPAGLSAKQLVAFPDQAAARQALEAGEISVFYVISPDYPHSGRVTAYMRDFNLMTAINDAELESLINFNLLGGNARLFRGVNQPIQHLVKESLSPPKNANRENNRQAALSISWGVLLLFFGGIMVSSTLLLNSLLKEKENLVIEMLMVSASPMQLLTGKIAGLGLIGLVQTIVWLLSMLVILRLSGKSSQLPTEFLLQPSFIGWSIVFFVLGYLVYASILAGVGALVPNLRQASEVTTFVMLPVFIPQILAPGIISNPHSSLAVIFSLFPLTGPIMIMMRLAMDDVPLWQLLLSAALLVLTVLLLIRLVAGLFRAQTILTGKGFRFSVILDQIRDVYKR